MKVLVGCEYSGRVRDRFIGRGHQALSVDLITAMANQWGELLCRI